MAFGKNLHQGMFKPKHPEKYKGDPTKIQYRSSWERSVMNWCDSTSSIVQWASEELCVDYIDRGSGKHRRYFPDFLIKVKQADGSFQTIMIEVKPYKETIAPVPPKRNTKKAQERFLTEVQTFATNTSKWEYAEEYCKQRGWKFMIFTENEIFGKGKK